MSQRVNINPELLTWARERAGKPLDELAVKFKKLPDWESGRDRPTFKQLERFAKAVYVPFGYLFLSGPPDEKLPIPDFRTPGSRPFSSRPSPNLLDVLYACQERQDWYRDFAQSVDQDPVEFVGSCSLTMRPEDCARRLSGVLGFDLAARRECPTWEEALRTFIRQAEDAGVLVMVSGVVGSNNTRKLDPREFRGFALSDQLAPLIFINGGDGKAAQAFTLAHELAHLALGQSALGSPSLYDAGGSRREETWCNRVAAELLVPLDALRGRLVSPDFDLQRLAREFKVSSLVIVRRLLDAQVIDRDRFEELWRQENERFSSVSKSAGGDFFRTTRARVGRRFAQAVFSSTLGGQTLYRDAFRMLGVRKQASFESLGREVGALL